MVLLIFLPFIALNFVGTYATWRYLPDWVWPNYLGSRIESALRLWWARNRLPLRWRWNAAKTWPLRTTKATFALYMLWRVRPANVHIVRLTCRACGLRAKAIHAIEKADAKPSRRYRHVIQFHPQAKKIVALCGRCQATWPEEPIYAVEGWLPPIPPAPRGSKDEGAML